MPILTSRFHPPAFLRNGHAQTILPVLLRRKLAGRFARERLELEDGDFLDLDWSRHGYDRLAILTHGLEGCTDGFASSGRIAPIIKQAIRDPFDFTYGQTL